MKFVQPIFVLQFFIATTHRYNKHWSNLGHTYILLNIIASENFITFYVWQRYWNINIMWGMSQCASSLENIGCYIKKGGLSKYREFKHADACYMCCPNLIVHADTVCSMCFMMHSREMLNMLRNKIQHLKNFSNFLISQLE